MNRRRRIARVLRLLEHYRRIRDEKASALAQAESRAAARRREIGGIRGRLEDANRHLKPAGGGRLDLDLIVAADAYKRHLRAKLERERTELRQAESEVSVKRGETTEAYRTHKVWEIVKDKLALADTEDTLLDSQRELDELAQRRADPAMPSAGGGSKGRMRR